MSSVARMRIGVIRVLLISLTATACDEAVSVTGDFDPRGAADAVETITAVGSQAKDAFASLELAAPQVFPDASAAALLPADARLLTSANALQFAGVYAAPFFPANYLGVTFVYDVIAGAYVAGEQTGAPADGVRILYYAVDPISGRPTLPLNALGYVDLRDLGGASSERMGIRIIQTSGASDVALADYYIDVAVTQTPTAAGVIMSAPGFLSDGTDMLDFSLHQQIAVSESEIRIEQDHTMGLAGGPSIGFDGTLISDFETQSATYAMVSVIEDGPNRVVLDVEIVNEVLAGEIRHNGVIVAIIGGTTHAPTFTGADGQPLDDAARVNIRNLFDGIDPLLELAASVFAFGSP